MYVDFHSDISKHTGRHKKIFNKSKTPLRIFTASEDLSHEKLKGTELYVKK